MAKIGDHYDVEHGGDVRLNGETIGHVDDGSFFLWNGHRVRAPSFPRSEERTRKGPAYEAWTDLEAARRDVQAQMRELMKLGKLPRALAMNDATRRHLGILWAQDEMVAQQTTYSEIRGTLVAGGLRKFMGLGIQIDETVLEPQVRQHGVWR